MAAASAVAAAASASAIAAAAAAAASSASAAAKTAELLRVLLPPTRLPWSPMQSPSAAKILLTLGTLPLKVLLKLLIWADGCILACKKRTAHAQERKQRQSEL
jgi:hypothetical protein